MMFNVTALYDDNRDDVIVISEAYSVYYCVYELHLFLSLNFH